MTASFSCVIDANLLLKTVSDEDYTVEMLDFFGGITPGLEVYAPVLARLECANVLRTRVLRFNYPVDDAARDLHELLQLTVTYLPIDTLITRAFEFGCRYRVSAYDGVYLALADSLRLPFFTADRPAATNLQASPYQIVTPGQFFGAPR
jgi:predicted nucleic acid-binding protein